MDEAIIKRILPHSIDAEKAVIGSMIMDADAVVAASEMITGDDFYQRQYGILFDAMVELYNEGKPVDVLTLQERLKMKDVPEEFSSIEFISELVSSVPTSANVRHYAQTVSDDATLRRLIRVNEEIANTCYQHRESLDEIMNTTEKRIDKIEAAARHKGTVTGLATGFYDLDYKTSGLQPSDLILIAARPSMGKTAFVLSMARNMAVKHHQAVAIFSLEMSAVQLVNRLIASETELSAEKLKTGRLTDEEWQQLHSRIKALVEAPILVDDTPALSIFELRAKCRRLKQKYGIKVLIIDYLQLMTAGADMRGNREQEVSLISRQLKIIAKELSIPVMALSQLNRGVESRPDKKPMLSDLRESGSIEQDADIVTFLYREDYYKKDPELNDNIVEVIFAKHRSGAVGTVKLAFRKEISRFENLVNVPESAHIPDV